MRQDAHVSRKISYIAAQAASVIVHCPLSIVNFSGFAITSGGFATGSLWYHDGNLT
jgi:hypothetical protein